MTQRITRAFVEARIDNVNRLMGFVSDDEPDKPYRLAYNTVGAIYLSSAYNGYAVYQWMNDAGGVNDLSGGHGTLREAATFLQGMITALHEARHPGTKANVTVKGHPTRPPYTVEGCEHCAGCGEQAWECVCEGRA